MKKLLLLVSVLGLTASAFAQGTISFANSGLANTYKISTNNAAGTALGFMTGTAGYRIALYAAAGAGASESSLTLVGLATNAAPAAAAGYFSGGNPFTVNGLGGAGTVITFQLRAWTFSAGDVDPGGPTPEIAYGRSALGQTTLGGGTTPAGALWQATNPQGITGFTIAPVIPEPSSIALGLLGLGAVALIRRRK